MIDFTRLEKDKELFRQLRRILLRSERLWLLDCGGDYGIYQNRLMKLAADYKIEIPERKGTCQRKSNKRRS
jgi:hypothetical protein